MYDIVAIGELLIDFAPVPDQTGVYPVMKANPGGAPANFLAVLSKYGAKTHSSARWVPTPLAIF